MNMTPTVFLSITHGFQARDLLRTEVFRTIADAGVHVVILTPNDRDEYFQREFARPGVTIVPLHTATTRLEAAMGAFRRYALANLKLNRTINALNERFHRSRTPRHLALKGLNAVFGRMRIARQLWLALEALAFPGHEYDALFAEYRPSLLVTGTAGSIAADAHLLRAARRHRVKTACVVLSWDNLTSKGHMAARPDELIVWNDIMRREAEELHDYPAARVYVAGVSHFDVYAGPSRAGTREAFCASMGLDPSRRILVFGTVTPWLFPHNGDIAEILARAISEGRVTEPSQLVIRLHPQVISSGTQHSENIDRFERVAQMYPHVHLDRPRVRSSSLMWDVSSDDMAHLADLLRYADVTLNAGSTLSIDSAIVDTPIVNVGFDGYAEPPAAESVIRIYDFTHYANIVRTGGVRIARSADEMIHAINAYLADRSLDRAGRARIVQEQCYRIDGRSGTRVGARLLQIMGLEPATAGAPDPVVKGASRPEATEA